MGTTYGLRFVQKALYQNNAKAQPNRKVGPSRNHLRKRPPHPLTPIFSHLDVSFPSRYSLGNETSKCHCGVLLHRGARKMQSKKCSCDNDGKTGDELYEFHNERKHPPLRIATVIIFLIVHPVRSFHTSNTSKLIYLPRLKLRNTYRARIELLTGFISGDGGKEILIGLKYRRILRAQFLDNPLCRGGVSSEIGHLRKVIENIVVRRILLNQILKKACGIPPISHRYIVLHRRSRCCCIRYRIERQRFI